MPVISNAAARGAGASRHSVLRVWPVIGWAAGLALLSPALSDRTEAQYGRWMPTVASAPPCPHGPEASTDH